jgi:hypothetical protein
MTIRVEGLDEITADADRELSTTGLAGFCAHGVGMLDQCDGCCPPRTVKGPR